MKDYLKVKNKVILHNDFYEQNGQVATIIDMQKSLFSESMLCVIKFNDGSIEMFHDEDLIPLLRIVN